MCMFLHTSTIIFCSLYFNLLNINLFYNLQVNEEKADRYDKKNLQNTICDYTIYFGIKYNDFSRNQ